MWRPENWDSPYPSKPSFVAQREAFEAGADAMYEPAYEKGRLDEREALRKEGFDGKLIVEIWEKHTDSKTTSIYLDTIEEMMKRYSKEQIKKGKWVFIPDKEVKE